MSTLTAAQLASMRSTFSGVMPNVCSNPRTSTSTVCWLEEDKSVYEPGLSALALIPRWRILQPAGTDTRRGDFLQITGMGTYQVLETLIPESYQLAAVSLALQTKDSAGTVISPIYTNATVKCIRSDSQVGGTRRVRLELVAEGAVDAAGEILPDTLWDVADADWALNDVLEIVSVDGHTAVPKPNDYRVGVVTRIGDLPPLTTARITGLGGYSNA